ncbi:hypothetical protein U27_05128 [Candidatus Vecturithrix granuli]|uniref:Uncharacterized protein n=1 Tax=Vecturithrix granuli TaxID=1499967 RepID=A0A081C0Q0_VECG1|nr:hypothetical protein U27_05128 [Candidatus Vecturithrix granuli]
MLKLPFKYIESFSGDSKLSKSKRQEKQIEADTIELQKYLNELCKNPGINKEFDAFLKKNNLNGELEPHEIVTEKESIQSQDSIITNALPRKLTFDVELLAKFFIKIALTHTIKEFGNQILQESIAKWMLKYIKSGHIEESFLKQFKEGLTGSDFEALFRKAWVKSEILYWWKTSPDDCLNYSLYAVDKKVL